MHIEFIDLLRCPEPHEETWLVAALDRMNGRDVVEAKLGCPVCKREFFIRDGAAIFVDASSTAEWETVHIADRREAAAAADPMRIAAVLDLATAGKLVLVVGRHAGAADEVASFTDARVLVLNPVWVEPGYRSDRVAVIRAGPRLPLASSSLDGIVADYSHSTAALVSEAARLLKARGRLAADVSTPLSPQFKELARDGDQVVVEYVGDLVPLRR